MKSKQIESVGRDDALVNDIQVFLNSRVNEKLMSAEERDVAIELFNRFKEECRRAGLRFSMNLKRVRQSSKGKLRKMDTQQFSEIVGLRKNTVSRMWSGNNDEWRNLPSDVEKLSCILSLALLKGESADCFLLDQKRTLQAPTPLSIFLSYFFELSASKKKQVEAKVMAALDPKRVQYQHPLTLSEIRERILDFYDGRAVFVPVLSDFLQNIHLKSAIIGLITGTNTPEIKTKMLIIFSLIYNVPLDYLLLSDYTGVDIEWQNILDGNKYRVDSESRAVVRGFIQLSVEDKAELIGGMFQQFAFRDYSWLA